MKLSNRERFAEGSCCFKSRPLKNDNKDGAWLPTLAPMMVKPDYMMRGGDLTSALANVKTEVPLRFTATPLARPVLPLAIVFGKRILYIRFNLWSLKRQIAIDEPACE